MTEYRQVLKRFPEQAELVARLAGEDQAFRSLCEDYTLVVETLAELRAHKRLPKELQEAALREYGIFLSELELDIADALACGPL
jgi:hypothetical protein